MLLHRGCQLYPEEIELQFIYRQTIDILIIWLLFVIPIKFSSFTRYGQECDYSKEQDWGFHTINN